MRRVIESIRRVRNRLTLGTQLSAVVALCAAVLIVALTTSDYRRQAQAVIARQAESTQTILTLEMRTFDQALRELAYFCIQPRNDAQLFGYIQGDMPLDSAADLYIKNKIIGYYLSRSDLRAYSLSMSTQGMDYRWTLLSQHVRATPTDGGLFESEAYRGCLKSPRHEYIGPAENGFLSYHHFIIRIQGRKPVAMVSVVLDRGLLDGVLLNHQSRDEFLCLFNAGGVLLYSGDETLVSAGVGAYSAVLGALGEQESVSLGGEEYLASSVSGEYTGLRMVSLTPKRMITEQLRAALRQSLAQALLLWVLCVGIFYAVIRALTAPLNRLAGKIKLVGKGSFKESVDMAGSREVAGLSESFNYMTRHIDRLIEKNYLAEINEKTAQLVALEAQLNPHFLYNALQAVATEALLVDQPAIYRMITALSSNLRYTVKGGERVRLLDEMNYVGNYILLQAVRMGDALAVEKRVAEDTGELAVPRLSVQTLVENAIEHGAAGGRETLHIELSTERRDETLVIRVHDDGCGIPADKLSRLRERLLSPALPTKGESVGLINLSNRIRIMYGARASLTVASGEGSFTEVTLLLPAMPL